MKMFEEKTRREFEFNKTRFRRFYSTKIAYKFYHRISLCWNIQWMRISLEAILKIARYFIWYFEVHWGAQAVATSWEKKKQTTHTIQRTAKYQLKYRAFLSIASEIVETFIFLVFSNEISQKLLSYFHLIIILRDNKRI